MEKRMLRRLLILSCALSKRSQVEITACQLLDMPSATYSFSQSIAAKLLILPYVQHIVCPSWKAKQPG
jgi:hypothetical protein